MKTDDLGMGRVILTVYCGQCAAEGVRSPGRVGHVAGAWARLLWWCTQTRTRPRQPAEYEALDSPLEEMPERLPAYCPRHGTGTVATADVLADTQAALVSSVQDVVLPFTA